jgi:tetratricopeptide (TPR) repeat protein
MLDEELDSEYELIEDILIKIWMMVKMNIKEKILKYLHLDDKSKAKKYNNKGLKYEKQGNYELAEKYYKKSIELNPNDFIVWYNLGNMYFGKGILYRLIYNNRKEYGYNCIKKANECYDKSLEIYYNGEKIDKKSLKNILISKSTVLNKMFFIERNKPELMEEALKCLYKAYHIDKNDLHVLSRIGILILKIEELIDDEDFKESKEMLKNIYDKYYNKSIVNTYLLMKRYSINI